MSQLFSNESLVVRLASGVWMFVLLFFTQFTVLVDRMASNFLGPFMVRDLALAPQQVGLIAGATGVCWALSALGFGAISDRIGRRAVLVPAVFVFAVCSVLSGLARNFEELLCARALLGLAEGPCFAITMALAEAWSAPGDRARNVGMVNSAGPLAAGLTPLLVTQVALVFDWRTSFFVVAVPGLVIGFLLWMFVREPAAARVASPEAARDADPRSTVAILAGNRDLWLCMAGAFGLVASVIPFVVFAPLYLTQVVHLDEQATSALMSAVGFGGVLWSFFGTGIADRMGRKKALLLLALLNVASVLVFLAAPRLGMGTWTLGGLGFILSAGPAVGALVMAVIPTELVDRRHAATAIGFTAIGAELIGGSLAPALAGTLAHSFGLDAPLWLAAAGGVLVIVVALLIKETAPRAGSAFGAADRISA